jgi:hypothetical protein
VCFLIRYILRYVNLAYMSELKLFRAILENAWLQTVTILQRRGVVNGIKK